MNAKLISHTKSDIVESIEDLICFTARVSNPDSQHKNLSNDKLIKYLMRNKHWSPFEMADITIEVECSLDIATQILRHRSFSFQQFSQRYSNIERIQGYHIKEARLQDEKNRQNSLETDDAELKEEWLILQRSVAEYTETAYNWAIKNGIAKEVARNVLPQMTNTRLYIKGSVRTWIHYLDVRLDKTTQKEHRELALQIKDILKDLCPLIF